MLRYFGKQLAGAAFNLVAITGLVFVLLNVLPSDPARVRLGIRYNERDAQAIRQQYGLDRPLHQQFTLYLRNLATGDLGVSMLSGERIADALRQRLPTSLTLIGLSFGLALPWGLLGIAAARRPSGAWSRVESGLFTLGVVPVFVIAVLVVYASSRLGFSLIVDERARALVYLLVPAQLLALYPSFVLFKIYRDSLGAALKQPFAVAQRALGFPEAAVARFALRSVSIPVLSIATNLTAYYLSSIYIVEFVFSLGGIGRWAVNSAQNYDNPAVLATVLVSAVIYNVVNVATAAVAPVLDPRVLRA